MDYIPQAVIQAAKEYGTDKVKRFVVGEQAYYSAIFTEKGAQKAVGLPIIFTLKDGGVVELSFEEVCDVLSKIEEE